VAQLACTTVYAPPDEPLTKNDLADAIQTLQETGERVMILEGGLQVEVYVYERRRVSPPPEIGLDGRLLSDPVFPEDQQTFVLTGPPRSVYLPYASIRTVKARSWPMWSGVELVVVEEGGEGPEGPLVIEAQDVEDAERLADSIDRIRRARQLDTRAPAAPAPAD
jgi:hypothetical protein